MANKTPGYYVEGRHFGIRHAQAMARATHLANLYGRAVDVVTVDHNGYSSVDMTCVPHRDHPSKVGRGDWSAFLRDAVALVEDMP